MQYPEISRAYELYRLCRSVEVVVAAIPKHNETHTKITSNTTGFSVLPEPGGMLDQPYRLMELFQLFMAGDSQSTLKNLS